MWNPFKKKDVNIEEDARKARIEYLQDRLDIKENEIVDLKFKVSTLECDLTEAKDKIKELEAKIKELESDQSKKVTYAQGRKVLTKAKLKALRAQIEAVPSNAKGFGGSVTVYDKKTKRLSFVSFESKSEALEILEKAEKGNVDIVI